MNQKPQEWLKQADYDLDTAEFMFSGGRYFYAVFMCHLVIEKALKGLYLNKKGEIPPKVHNLIYFLNQTELKPAELIGKFIIKLNEASVATRYPENLEEINRNYTKEVVRDIILHTREALEWIKQQF